MDQTPGTVGAAAATFAAYKGGALALRRLWNAYLARQALQEAAEQNGIQMAVGDLGRPLLAGNQFGEEVLLPGIADAEPAAAPFLEFPFLEEGAVL